MILGKIDLLIPTLQRGLCPFMEWADEFREIGVRANADIPRDAMKAVKFGAEGIGLCRTEHMFFAKERLPHVQQMIMACKDTQDPKEAASTEATARGALEAAAYAAQGFLRAL